MELKSTSIFFKRISPFNIIFHINIHDLLSVFFTNAIVVMRSNPTLGKILAQFVATTLKVIGVNSAIVNFITFD